MADPRRGCDDGRVPVIVGTGTNSTATTIEATKVAADFGADAALVVTPYYNRPSQEGLLRHYEAVEEASELPLLLYNVPGRTGVDLLPDTVSRLSELSGIVGINEATSNADRIAVLRHLSRADFKVYSGDDGSAVHAMTSGADGCMSVIANALPRDWRELCELTLRGRTAESGRLHAQLQPLLEALSLETNPGPVKYLMSLVCRSHSPEVRLPLLPVKSATATRIRTALDTYLAWRGPDSRFPDAA